MPHTTLGIDSRALAAKTNQAIEVCTEDASLCKSLLNEFIKDNKDRFVDKDVAFLLDMWDSLDLMKERIKTANEDLSDILFGSDE